MNRYLKLGLAACCALSVLTVAMAQNAPPTPEQRAAQAVKTRQAVMDVNQFSYGPAAGMLRNAPFDAAVVQKSAARLKVTTGMIADAFKTDTTKFDVKTRAKPEVWTDKAGFDMGIQDVQGAVSALESAAMGGDKDATLKAVGAVRKSCDGCHDKFREKAPAG